MTMRMKPRDLVALRQALHDRKRQANARARALRPPDAAVLAYARDLGSMVDAWQAHVIATLRPHLSVLEGSTGGWVTSAPDSPDAQIGFRGDALPTSVENAMQWLRDTMDEWTLSQGINRILDQSAGRVNQWTIRELSRSLGIDIMSAGIGVGPLIEQFRIQNVLLIQDNFRGSLQGVADTLDANIGMRVEGLATELESSFGMTRNRANLIARDQTLKLNSQVNRQRQNEVGVTHYIWISSGDERVRGRPDGKWPVPKGGGGDHWILRNQTFSWLEPPVTNTRTGARNHPGEDYQCRCTATPVLTGILD